MSTDRDLREQAYAWLIALETDASDGLNIRLNAWRKADPAHEAAWHAAQAGWAASRLAGWRLAEAEADTMAEYLRAMDAQTTTGKRRRAATVAGAVLTLFLGVAIWLERPHLLQDLGADQVAGRGERPVITLPDGSTVQMNSDSAMDVEWSATERRVHLLRGTAFFDVTPSDLPFVVQTDAGTVRVLGTRFDLRLRPEGGIVTLERGLVEVEAAGRSVRIAPGQQVAFSEKGTGSVQPADLVQATAWRDGRLDFHQMRLGDVMDEIGRYRPGRIVFLSRALAETRVTGSIMMDDTDVALDALQSSVGFDLRRLTRHLTVIGP